MSFKIPCGGFKLDEKSFSLDKNDVLSIPKPLTYDYMPEGYPKKGGWSVEWDGNIDGKTSAIGAPIYKFSDRVMTYEEFLIANYVVYVGGEQHSGMVSEKEPKQNQLAYAVSMFVCLNNTIQVVVVSEDNAEVGGTIFPTKGLYVSKNKPPFKLIKGTITPMSADFIPKNLNVVFIAETGSIPTSYNVTYDELRGWVENNIPVLSIYRHIDSDYLERVESITTIQLKSDSLVIRTVNYGFVYNSDGTFSTLPSS